jgi:hypothetical protein
VGTITLTLAGCQSTDIYDVSGDGIPDVSIDDLKTALDVLNNAFDECSGELSCLGFP